VQLSHEDEPISLELPASHVLHIDAPVKLEKRPAAHISHNGEPAVEKFPGAQY
jgi:hypothetical protein